MILHPCFDREELQMTSCLMGGGEKRNDWVGKINEGSSSGNLRKFIQNISTNLYALKYYNFTSVIS